MSCPLIFFKLRVCVDEMSVHLLRQHVLVFTWRLCHMLTFLNTVSDWSHVVFASHVLVGDSSIQVFCRCSIIWRSSDVSTVPEAFAVVRALASWENSTGKVNRSDSCRNECLLHNNSVWFRCAAGHFYRDLGEHLRTHLKDTTELPAKQLDALERIARNKYIRAYPRTRQTSSSTYTRSEIYILLAEESMKVLGQKRQGFLSRLVNSFKRK